MAFVERIKNGYGRCGIFLIKVDRTSVKLSQHLVTVDDEDIQVHKRSVVLMSDRSSVAANIYKARLDILDASRGYTSQFHWHMQPFKIMSILQYIKQELYWLKRLTISQT